MADLPLNNILILDLTRVLSGPFCTMNLHNLGARVIKIEKPPVGDDSRTYPPFQEKTPIPFHAINHGKESIALDIKNNEKDREVFNALLQKADVLIENFTPGFMKSIGYDWSAVKAINPNIIYASISGFGHTGPNSNRACYDLVTQGLSGLMSITGHPQDKPVKVGTEIADIISGIYAALGINAALYQRTQTGVGSHIDIAMLDCLVALLPTTISPASATGLIPHAIGNRHPLLAPFDVYFTQDDPISICIGNDNLFAKLCDAMGRPDLAGDERFSTNPARVKNVEELTTLLNGALAKKTAKEWLEYFEEKHIPAGPINTVDQMLEDKQLKARNMLLSFADGFLGNTKVPGNPIKFSDTEDRCQLNRGPRIGEHTESILKELGL